MSSQSGGNGEGKKKKTFQTGGASGWAKHCGDTKDHQMSNRSQRRTERRLLGEDGVEDARPRGKLKKNKKPTRRHLMDKLNHIDHQIAKRVKEMAAHRAKNQNCKCYGYCSDRWIDRWHAKEREVIIEEFKKHGYDIDKK